MANAGCKCSSKINHRAEDCKAPEVTTAQVLGAYARELQGEGASDETVAILTVEAARHLLRGGDLVVRMGGAGPFGGTWTQ